MKGKILIFSMMILISFGAARAEVNLGLSTGSMWIGDKVNITCWATDNTTNATSMWAYVSKTGQNLTLVQMDDTHFSYLYTPPLIGLYSLYCSDGLASSAAQQLEVSNLSIRAVSIPSELYLQDSIGARVEVVKITESEEKLSSGVEFKISLDSINIDTNPDSTYYQTDQWVITTYPVTNIETKNYTLSINATYGGRTASLSGSMAVKEQIDFIVTSVDKTWFTSNETITIGVRAKERGTPIVLQASNLSFEINSISCTVTDISKSGDIYYVKIQSPQLPSGTYELKTTFQYKGENFIDRRTVSYVVPVSGIIVDSGGRGVAAELKFISSAGQHSISTDGSGQYSGTIPSGTYDLQLTFPSSSLYLKSVSISNFQDPVKFDHVTDDASMIGIKTADVFVFEIDLTYPSVSIEMKYDDRNIVDESQIEVYRCKNWNFGRKSCSGAWEEVDASVDSIRNLVKLNSTGLSAFAIGTKKMISVSFELEKKVYYLKEIMKVRGMIEDEDGEPVPDIQVRASVKGTEASAAATSDGLGSFSIELLAPQEEGNYSLNLRTENSPFAIFNKTVSFEVVRSKSMAIMFPDSVRVGQGDILSIEATLLNSGQTDFSNITISISGVPKEYYTLPQVDQLLAGEEKTIKIEFSLPGDADKTAYTAALKASADGLNAERPFVLTVITGNSTQPTTSTPPFQFPDLSQLTGFSSLAFTEFNANYTQAAYIAALSIACFSIALIARRKKRRKVDRGEIKNLLMNIKKEARRTKGSLLQKEKQVKDNIKIIEEATSKFLETKSKIEAEQDSKNAGLDDLFKLLEEK